MWQFLLLFACTRAFNGWYLDLCVLQDIAVEAAFPPCGVIHIKGYRVELNERTMSSLESGKEYHSEGDRWGLTAGSRGEQLAMEDTWGHPDTDWDWMFINGGPMGVYVTGGHTIPGQSCLHFRPEGCPAAYCKLEVTDISRLMESRLLGGDKWCDGSCIDVSHGKLWLNTYNAVRKMKDTDYFTRDNPTIGGPASQSADNIDTVQTLVCSGPHPELHKEFRSRPRGSWPPLSLIKYILQMPMLLVLVGHKGSSESEFRQQARMSWSHLELKLIQELPENVRQGYIACKYVMKRFLEAHWGQNKAVDGRTSVCSYHLKTLFLRFLEKRPPSQITSPLRLFLDLLRQLDKCLKVGNLPHYFLAECNLLETVADDERGIARQVITKILSNPLNALLTSPTDPRQIYGEVYPSVLMIAFHWASSHPTCEQYRKLSELLACVDERRRQRYEEQRKLDERDGVFGRSEITGLTDICWKSSSMMFFSTFLH